MGRVLRPQNFRFQEDYGIYFQVAIILNCISMKSRYPWSEGLINLFRFTLPSSQNAEQLLTWSQLAWIGGFNDMAGIAFSGLQNDEKLHIRKPCILQPKVSWPLKNLIVRPQKGRTESLWMLVSCGSRVLRPWRKSFSGRQNSEQRLY
jgi:hypothetical protein